MEERDGPLPRRSGFGRAGGERRSVLQGNVQRPTFNAQPSETFPKFDVRRSMFDVRRSMFDVRLPLSPLLRRGEKESTPSAGSGMRVPSAGFLSANLCELCVSAFILRNSRTWLSALRR